MFYQLVYKENTNNKKIKDTDPLIFWFNGGPGCASQYELFEEAGPFSVLIKDDGSFQFTARVLQFLIQF